MDLYRWKKTVAGLVFPHCFCLCCGSVTNNEALCASCAAQLARLRPCPDCATFIAATETADYRCRNCRGQERSCTLSRAAAPYAGELRRHVLAFKYQQRTGLRRPLAQLLLSAFARHFAAQSWDAIVPIPLSAARLEQRGYNQAQLLSELLCAETGLPHCPSLLQRVRDSQPLFPLERRQREAELKGAFRATPAAAGQRILLIDDIYTTGATVSAAARALRNAGAAEVCALTVAAGHDL